MCAKKIAKLSIIQPGIHRTIMYDRGDHRIGGRYDNVWSVLRPDQIGPLHKPP